MAQRNVMFPAANDEDDVEEGTGIRARRSLSSLAELSANQGANADIFGITDRGCVRPNNEDQFLIAELERSILVQHSSVPQHDGTTLTANPQGRIMIVADGMGGHEGGEVASAVAIDAMARYAFTVMPWLLNVTQATQDELAAALQSALSSTHAAVQRAAVENQLDARMGTTLTMAYVVWPELYVLHAGDTRCYLLRDGKLSRLTRDHTMAQQLVERRAITQEEADRSRFKHVLVNVVGGSSPQVYAEFHHLHLLSGDKLLLCSDGLTEHLSDEQIATFLQQQRPAESIARALVTAAKDAGGTDNVTAVVSRF
jgi:protein phosphatase